MSKETIDVCTTSTPVLLTEQDIRSFLICFKDRCDYNLRWICHLDQYPLKGLEKYWNETAQQILRVSECFDDAYLMFDRVNQSYGTSVCRVLAEVRNPVLYIEDDKYWRREFCLSEIRQRMKVENADQFVFYHIPTPGTTTPSFWEQDKINVLRDNPKNPTWKITETHWVRVCARHNIKAIGPSIEDLGKQVRRRLWENSFWVDMGKHQLRYLLGHKNILHPASRFFDKGLEQERTR